MFGRVHSFPFVSPSPLGAEFFRLLTRAGLMSLADVSSGGSCDLFGFLEGWALFEGWGFGLLTRAGLMLLVVCGFHSLESQVFCPIL
jgi:hypothetical protein